MERNPLNYQVALRDFHQARKQAAMQQMLARIRRRSADLLCYDDVRRQLHASNMVEHGLQEIPLQAIVGSVGRHKDFTRRFMPKKDSDEERWAQVKTAVMDMKGMPPIEVYQLGETYFVKDGNHRVSIAHQLGTPTISAYVTEVQTRVPITPDDDPNELICKARYADFLSETDLDKLRPEADLFMTVCGHYDTLLRQIEVEQTVLSREREEEVMWETAVCHWYDAVYLPLIEIVRDQGVLHDFPSYTEADLYILLSEYRSTLETALGWSVDAETAVMQLAPQKSRRPRRVISRVGERLRGAMVPSGLEDGPTPGRWRQERRVQQRQRLFRDILVAVRGEGNDWPALAQGLQVAQRENGRIHGLHIVADEAALATTTAKALPAGFAARCAEAEVAAEFAVEVGNVVNTIIKRAVWADLVVAPLNYPPREGALPRVSSGFKQLVQRCSRPILAVPKSVSPMDKVLLAYDGSPKAEEALFIAAYMATRWQSSLSVVTVTTKNTPSDALAQAESYLLRQGVTDANFVLGQQTIAEIVLETAVAHESNLLIMGGFGRRPMQHMMLGSTVDHMLREFKHPILICR